MCKVISVVNQKGGVGKTTTTVNVGIGLAREGKKVLLIDARSFSRNIRWQVGKCRSCRQVKKISSFLKKVLFFC